MQRRFILFVLSIGLVAMAAGGCLTPQEHARSVRAGNDGDRLTVGVVQREIRRGMSGAEVASVLGSPNVVSTDEKGREVWIYDKISTDVVSSTSDGFGWILILGASQSAAATSKSQRTLTVIIKFDDESKVRDFAYHSSRF